MNKKGTEKVKHPVYQDFAGLSYEKAREILNRHALTKQPQGARGGAKVTFPMKLHVLLESTVERKSAISWQHHGRAFKIHDKERFINEILPAVFAYDRQYSSFQRQLNIYMLLRISGGPDAGAYYHPLFLRSRPELCDLMQRKVPEKRRVRRAMDPATEPDLCLLAPMPQSRPQGYSSMGGALSASLSLEAVSYSLVSSTRTSFVTDVASAEQNLATRGDTRSSSGDDEDDDPSSSGSGSSSGSKRGAPANHDCIGRSNQPRGHPRMMVVDEAFCSLLAAARSPKRCKHDPNANDESEEDFIGAL